MNQSSDTLHTVPSIVPTWGVGVGGEACGILKEQHTLYPSQELPCDHADPGCGPFPPSQDSERRPYVGS